MYAIGLVVFAGGVWITQDGIASILYYLKHDNEKWYFNHAVRLFRIGWGIVFIVLGVIIVV